MEGRNERGWERGAHSCKLKWWTKSPTDRIWYNIHLRKARTVGLEYWETRKYLKIPTMRMARGETKYRYVLVPSNDATSVLMEIWAEYERYPTPGCLAWSPSCSVKTGRMPDQRLVLSLMPKGFWRELMLVISTCEWPNHPERKSAQSVAKHMGTRQPSPAKAGLR